MKGPYHNERRHTFTGLELRGTRAAWTVGLALSLIALLPSPASAQQCDRSGCQPSTCAQPARPAPSTLWGDLEAIDPNPLPADRDASAFRFNNATFESKNWFVAVDVETDPNDGKDYLFTGLAHGFQVWSLANPASPTLTGQVRISGFPFRESDPHVFHPLFDADATEDTSMAAIAGTGGTGITVFDLSSKSSPRVAYQNHEKEAKQVYVTSQITGQGKRHFGFLAVTQGSPTAGLLAFDMTAAKAFTSCAETTPDGATQCAGVYLGRVGTKTYAEYVDGVDSYVVVSAGAQRGLEIWDISNIANPPNRFQLKLSGLSTKAVYGVAMWKDVGQYYLGAISSTGLAYTLEIYDVTCYLTGSCGSTLTTQPLSVFPVTRGSVEQLLTYSRSAAKSFLYVGSDDQCSSGTPQREFFLDVSNPSDPRNLSSAAYFDWYYRGSATGFNYMTPRAAKIKGEYLYRAGFSIMDVHRVRVNQPPTAPAIGSLSLTPSTPAVCQTVTVTANNVTGYPTPSYTWSVTNQAGTTNPVSNSPSLTLPSVIAGPYTVQATATNTVGSDTKSIGFTPTAPPALPADGTFTPTNDAFSAGTVTFHVNVPGASEWSWDFGDGAGFRAYTSDPVTGPNPTNAYTTTGAKTVRVKVRNCVQPEKTSGPLSINIVTITPLQAAFQAQGCQFGFCVFTVNQSITFTDSSTGAQTWKYDWDGNGTVDQVSTTPIGSHTYASIGTYSPKLTVERGVETNTFTHAPITISSPVQPSISVFGPTSGQVLQSYTFSATASDCPGVNASGWFWTVSGGAITGATNTSSISVSWSTAGTKSVSAQNSGCSGATGFASITIAGSTGPSIVIDGPGTGTPSQSLTFIALGTNCTPFSSSPWVWDTAGGTGSSTTDTIQITWATAGTREITASNAACGSAVGRKTVTIGTGSGLVANFTTAPGSPSAGQTVTFDATSSQGAPTGYDWSFGDGSSGQGSVVTHAYATGGTYQVRLSIVKPGQGAGCTLGFCTAEKTQNVVVTGGTPNPIASFTTSATCSTQGGVETCQATAEQPVSFVSTSQNAPTLSWNFGDGETSTQASLTHAWSQGGTYVVTLTAQNGVLSSVATKTFVVASPSGPFLSLRDNRFEVRATWKKPNGEAGAGTGVRLTNDSGFFWFFQDTNLEIVVKVLNACAFNPPRYWVFAGGLTNVEVTLKVKDKQSGQERTYVNPQSTPYQPIQDGDAFATCP